MSAPDLRALRARGDDLDVGEEALAVYTQVLDLDPDDQAAANMIGRSLQALGRDDEAREHWTFVAELQPTNEIARSRARSQKAVELPAQVTSSRPTKPQRSPAELVDAALDGPGRGAALRFLARSIRLIEKIDPARLSVTERVAAGRFGVFGGREPAVTPTRGRLHVWVHAPAVTAELSAAVAATPGAEARDAEPSSLLPDSRELRLPFEALDAVSDLLVAPHREHVLRAIAAGPPPWGSGHDAKLRDHIVAQAAG